MSYITSRNYLFSSGMCPGWDKDTACGDDHIQTVSPSFLLRDKEGGTPTLEPDIEIRRLAVERLV